MTDPPNPYDDWLYYKNSSRLRKARIWVNLAFLVTIVHLIALGIAWLTPLSIPTWVSIALFAFPFLAVPTAALYYWRADDPERTRID